MRRFVTVPITIIITVWNRPYFLTLLCISDFMTSRTFINDVCTAEHNTRMIISSQSLMFQHNLITPLRLTCWANFNHDIRCTHIYLPLGLVRLDTIEFLTYLIFTNCFVVIFCWEWSGFAWFTFPYCIPFLHLCYAFLLSILSISFITWVVTLLYNSISCCIY